VNREHAIGIARAEQLLELRRPEEAKSQIALVLAAEPENATAQRVLVRALLQLKDPKAPMAAVRAIALAPDSEHGYRLASVAYTKAGMYEEAVGYARDAVRLAPHEWRAHQALANALLKQHPEKALEAAVNGVSLAPEEPGMHLAVGLAAMRTGHEGQARDAFTTVLKLSPDNPDARNNLAVLDHRANKFGAAIDGFGAALATDPRFDLARGNIDVVVIDMLINLRIVMLLSLFLAERARSNLGGLADQTLAVGILAVWGGTALWGYTRVPARLRRYALDIFRRRRRAIVIGVGIAAMVAGLVIGPLLGVVSAGLGMLLGSAVGLVSFVVDPFFKAGAQGRAVRPRWRRSR
jgi:Flp pilus assembly protein TadD